MGIARLLRPYVRKVILAGVLFAIVYVVQARSQVHPDYWAYGFPLHFQEYWGPCPRGQVCQAFNPLFLALDVLIWYIVGATLLTIGRQATRR